MYNQLRSIVDLVCIARSRPSYSKNICTYIKRFVVLAFSLFNRFAQTARPCCLAVVSGCLDGRQTDRHTDRHTDSPNKIIAFLICTRQRTSEGKSEDILFVEWEPKDNKWGQIGSGVKS